MLQEFLHENLLHDIIGAHEDKGQMPYIRKFSFVNIGVRTIDVIVLCTKLGHQKGISQKQNYTHTISCKHTFDL